MKLKHQAKKKTRVNYNFTGFTCLEKGYWYNNDLKKWVKNPKQGEYWLSTHYPCHSVKAFRRLLKKAPMGLKFKLVSRYKGCHVIGTGNLINNK